MTKINWQNEVNERKDQLLEDTKGLLQIKSVLDEENKKDDAPFGEGVKKALLYMLDRGNEAGFQTKNVDHVCGHIEYGEGEELVGILCHVDVVPEGDGWKYDPFGATVSDGKLYARGALDDKGPTMAAFYGLKIIKELGLKLSKRVRIIIGTDEESGMRCVQHYFKKEEMPTMGFAPDADFPIIYAEKGISSIDFTFNKTIEQSDSKIIVEHFSAGRRYNMVPDLAIVTLSGNINQDELSANFNKFLSDHQLEGSIEYVDGKTQIFLRGVSAHAMEPNAGTNAAVYLAKFLNTQPIDEQALEYFRFVEEVFLQDTRGEKLNVKYTDEVSGDLTVNAAIFSYQAEGVGKVGINIRYPVTYDMEKGKENIIEVAHQYGFEVDRFTNSKPHYVEENTTLIQTLKKVYEEQTGEEAKLIAIGGGTYARYLKTGVAFGPLFPGRPDVAHQKDEYMELDDLFKATAIYAQAIYELAK